jgi:hypothetical protein
MTCTYMTVFEGQWVNHREGLFLDGLSLLIYSQIK